MKDYLKETKMLNFNAAKLSDLIKTRGWRELDEFHKIGAAYDFVQNEILFGYNANDALTATEVCLMELGNVIRKQLC